MDSPARHGWSARRHESPHRARGGGYHRRRRDRHGVVVLGSRLSGCGPRSDRRALRRDRPSARSDHPSPHRGRRHVLHQGHRPHRPSRTPEAHPVRLLSLRSLVRGATRDPPDDRGRRRRRLQRPLRHPLRHAPGGGGEAARGADQGRTGHLRRPGAGRLRHDAFRRRRAHRAARAVRGRRLAVLSGHRAGRRDHPRHHRRRAGQSHVRARGRLSRSARSGAGGPQQRRHRDRPGEAARPIRIAQAPGCACPRHTRGLRGGGTGAASDHADRLRPRHLRRDPPPARELRASGAFGEKVIARRVAMELEQA